MSLISPSRREMLTRMIATGAGGVLLTSFSGVVARAQDRQEAVRLRMGVDYVGDATDEGSVVREWLQYSETIRATKNEFESGIHGEWANDIALKNDRSQYLQIITRFYKSSKVRSFHVVHTTVNGKEYRRSDQYTDTNLTDDNGIIRWSGWRSSNRIMVGTLYFVDGGWYYDEEVTHNDRIETTINTVCH
jgi:hypothetical protein